MKTILALAFLALPFTLQAQSNVDSSGVALKGYDPVAYFSEKKPVPGKPEFTARHEDAT